MADYSNFGIVLLREVANVYTAIAGIKTFKSPSTSVELINITNHGSTWDSVMGGTLKKSGEIKFKISYDPAVCDDLYTAVGTTCNFKIQLPNYKDLQFAGVMSTFDPGEADSEKEGLLTTEITLKPSGAITPSTRNGAPNWWTDVTTLGVVGGSRTLAIGATETLVVYGIKSDGTTVVGNNADLDFVSDDASCTAGLHTGLLTGISGGSALVTVCVTASPLIDDSLTVTVA